MTDRPASTPHDPRMAATRLAAVQAVYELDMMDVAVDQVLNDFTTERWLGADDEVADEMARPKPELLKSLVQGVAGQKGDIDVILAPALAKDRRLETIEALLRAILRTAVYELMERSNVPARTAIAAYTALGDAFYEEDGGQTRLIAGVLNNVARQLRPDEFSAAS